MGRKKQKTNKLYKIVVVAIFIIIVAVIINLAPNYIRKKITGKINIIINNNNVTESMKFDAFVSDNDIVYLSTKDIANFFDEDIFYDNKYNQIITTSSAKLATLELDKEEMYVNYSKVKIYGAAIKKDNEFYLPFSELKDVYNIEVNYIKDTNIVTIDSLDREQKKGNASKDVSIKFKPTIFSKTIDKVKKGDSLCVIKQDSKDEVNGWYKVRTTNGIIGYTKNVTNVYSLREELDIKPVEEEKISMVWDYYTNNVPDRKGTTINGINVISPSFVELIEGGKGEIKNKIGTAGKDYIEWAHDNSYKVWAMVSNNGYSETSSEILNDYKLREKLINNIVNLALHNNIDGINLDFENIKTEDKGMLSRFIIELAPRLREYGRVLSVDVTAPDGGTNWSECYDRNTIGRVADYIVFMAYDQYGTSSKEAGTTAGANWIEVALEKFVNREEIEPSKIILGMPFYTRLWTETESETTSKVIWMKSINNNIPSNVQKIWNEDLKQYYIEYNQSGKTYKMWIEDEESIKAKFALMKKYKLGGAAYWQKDFENSTMWDVIAQEIK